MPETSPFGPQDTQDSGWKLCPGPVGQQVENIGGIDEEEGIDKNPQMDGTVFVIIFWKDYSTVLIIHSVTSRLLLYHDSVTLLNHFQVSNCSDHFFWGWVFEGSF